MKIDTIIFDLGNVLIKWSPANLYRKIFKTEDEVDHFLNHVATMDWHTEQDGGRSPQEGTEALVKQHPDWEHHIRAFYGRWKEMFAGPIEGSVEIFKELKERGYKLYALSNWNAELFNQTLNDFPFFNWFDGKIISGEVKKKKPDADIYHQLFQTYGVSPQTALFIDDNEKNIQTARTLGLHVHHFATPEALRKELETLQIL